MLTDEQVKERTDVTVKMANVVGESAATVSEWMTAIWNNFDDGTRSLESYADVLTRLGAATASSADEIAGGLEKFAAVADTVGLSYDYAATALATITAETRVSEDVVGNALKTIFARIQGLSLGETLEDGVDLNKYSQALANVGIDVLDANGNLRDMDILLEEIGAKWQTLGSEQQTALAQTVAGVRQYSQFVALFDNWDTFQTNLAIAQSAEGDLQNQADIYEESWAAANKRLKASFEDLYDSVIDEDLFIDLTDGASKLVSGVAGVVDALGGMKGLLLLAGTIGSRVFAKDIAKNIDVAIAKIEEFNSIQGNNLFQKFQNYQNDKNIRYQGAKENGDALDEFGEQYLIALQDAQTKNLSKTTAGFRDQAQSLEQITRLQNKIQANSKNLSIEEQKKLEIQLKEVQALSAQKAEATEILTKTTASLEILRQKAALGVADDIAHVEWFSDDENEAGRFTSDRISRQTSQGMEAIAIQQGVQMTSILQEEGARIAQIMATEEQMINMRASAITQYTEVLYLNKMIKDIVSDSSISEEDRVKAVQKLVAESLKTQSITQQTANILKNLNVNDFLSGGKGLESYLVKIKNLENSTRNVARGFGIGNDELKEGVTLSYQQYENTKKEVSETLKYNYALERANNNLATMLTSASAKAQSLTTSLQLLSSSAMALNNWVNFGEMFSNPDVSWIQKATTFFSAMLMTVKPLQEILGKIGENLNNAGTIKGLTKIGKVSKAMQNSNRVTKSLGDFVFEEVTKGTSVEGHATSLGSSGIKKEDYLIARKKVLKDATVQLALAEYEEAKASNANTLAEKKEALQKAINTASTKTLTASIKEYIATALGVEVTTLPWLALGAAILAAGAALYYFSQTAERAQKAIDEANQKVEEQKSKVSEVESELESAKKEMQELQALGTLSLVEETELNKLKITVENLERQLEIEQELLKIEQQKAALEAKENFEDASSDNDHLITVQKNANEKLRRLKIAYETARKKESGQNISSPAESFLSDTVSDYGLISDSSESLEKAITRTEKELESYAVELGKSYSQALQNVLTIASGGMDKITEEEASYYQKELSDSRKAYQNDEVKNQQEIIDVIDKEYSYQDLINGKTITNKDLMSKGYTVTAEEVNSMVQENWNKALEAVGGKSSLLENYDFEDITRIANLKGIYTTEAELEKAFLAITTFSDEVFDIVNQFKTEKSIIAELETGDTIESTDWAALSEETQKYFQIQQDGTYKLIGSAENLRNVINQIGEGNVQEGLSSALDNVALVTGRDRKTVTPEWLEGVAQGAENGKGGVAQVEILSAYTGITQEQLDAQGLSFETTAEKAAYLASVYRDMQQAAASTADHLADLDELEIADENTSKQLAVIASQYEDCGDTLRDYNKIMKDSKSTDDQKRKATKKLRQEVNKAEWDKWAEDVEEYAEALKDATDEKEIKKNLKGIQKAFKDNLGLEVSMDFLERYKDKFVEWGQAGEEESDDIATSIKALYYAEQAVKNDIEGDTIVIDTETNLAGIKDIDGEFISLKSLIENNPIEVDANGRADLSGIVTALFETGATAATVAQALRAIGLTEVDLSGFGTGLPKVDLSTMEGLFAFESALSNWRGGILANGNLSEQDIDALNDAFDAGDLGISSGSYGGGRHTGGGGNSGGGGGGSSRKPSEGKNDTDKERYHTLNNQLEDIEDAYDDVSEAADRAFGKDKLDKISQQVDAIDNVIAKQKEYKRAIEDNLAIDKAIVKDYLSLGDNAELFSSIPGIQFDENGNIANFDDIQDAMYKLYNTKNQTITDDAEWDIFEKKYEQFWTYLEQYEETYDLLREKENELRDLANERLDLLVEQSQYKVELKLDISEDSLEILEYELSLLEDDALNLSSKIALLSEQTSTYYGQSQALSAGIEDILGKMQESGTMTEDAANALRDYKSQLIEVNENLLEMREAVQEGLVEAFEEWNDQIGEGLDKFDHYSSILDSYANIIDIVGKETLGIENEFLENLSQQQVSNSINNLAATREAYLSLEAAAAEAREKLAEAQAIDQDKLSESQKESIQKDILFWQEQLDTIEEEANSAAEDMYSTWEEALEAITTQFEQSVERAVEQFNEAVYGMGGLEQLSEDFARQQEMADMYLKDYEQIYELSKLNRDIQNSIDDTDSVAGKQKLKKLMQDINKLQAEGNEMSEYDLEYLQKTYDLRMAEIALEEAQHAKSQVRLQKDSEGNWAYVYTSAGDAVDEAQQKYEDALFAMQDVSSNYIDEMSEQLITTSQEMAEALANLRVEDFASQEEYEKKVAEVQETYAKQMAAQEAELNKAIDNNKVLYDTDWTNYSNATGYKISSTEEFVTSFKDSMLGLLTDSETDQSNFTSVIDAATEGLITGLLESASTFYTNLESAMVAAGTSTDEFATMAGEAIAELGKESEAARKSVSMLADEFTSGFASMTEAVQSWQGSYGTAIEAAIAANEEMAASINEVLEALSISPEDMTVSYNIYASGKHAASDETTAGYDTGGYTGQWGNSGKIAVLHEKELVLNKDDTTNMLAAVALVRTLTQTIDLNAARAGQGLGGLTASVMKDEVHETLEQQVTIHAEFPNVQDHNEVELALQNMINSSTQYANRK